MAELLQAFSTGVPQGEAQDPAPWRSKTLGTPVYQRVIFEAGSYTTDIDGQSKSWQQLEYDSVLILVTQAKKIIKTEIQGRDGTVKEYIGMDDYQITFTGVIVGSNGVHPSEEIGNLKAMLDAPVSVRVACDYLINLGITDLVIESYEFGQQAGGHSYQAFTINCSSDIPQELRLSDV